MEIKTIQLKIHSIHEMKHAINKKEGKNRETRKSKNMGSEKHAW